MTALHEDLLARRADYPGLARGTYLANHTLGAQHAGAAAGLAEYSRRWVAEGITAWSTWGPELERVADLVGTLIGAPAGTTVLRANVHDALTDIVSALPLTARPRIVHGDLEWPGTRYLLARWPGAQAVEVPLPAPGGVVDVGPLAAAVDERTSAVVLSHVFFRTSSLVDPAPVVEAAHRVGALVVLDAYQSAGAVPVRAAELGVDAVVGGSVKWLCGGPGNGWLHVAPHAAPVLDPHGAAGWFGHARPFAFDSDWERAPGGRGWTGGTPNVPAAYAAASAYEALVDIGVQRVRERSVSLTQPFVQACLERGWEVHSPLDPAHRGGSVTVDPCESLRVHDGLLERGVTVDHRPGAGLRVGPHFFNDAGELAHCVEEIAAVRAAV